MVNRRKLKAKIIEKGLTMTEFAEMLNISRTNLTYKLTGSVDWSGKQISEIIKILNLSPVDVVDIFFDSNLSNMTNE